MSGRMSNLRRVNWLRRFKPSKRGQKKFVDQAIHRYPGQRVVTDQVGRNEKCPCGSGKKYKHCCLAADQKKGARGR